MQRLNKCFPRAKGIGVTTLIGLFAALGGFFSGVSPVTATTANPVSVQQGDVVQVHVTATMDDGSVLFTTRKEVLEGAEWIKNPGFGVADPLAPEEVVAGQSSRIPGLGQAVLGLTPNVTRKLTIPAEEAFGKPDPALRRDFPCERSVSRILRLPAERYLQLAGTFPKEGQSVELLPYLHSRVSKVEDAAVVLEFSAKDGRQIVEDFGTVTIQASTDQIRTRLQPKLGAPFMFEGKSGKIVSSDGSTFTVDFNPPQLGHELTLDIEVLSRIPADSLAGNEIAWEKELDKGLDRARNEGKPVVMVLYAEWCSWCERFFNESIQDQRVKSRYDRYVWVKINSDVEKQFMEKYEQKGFPMIVLLSSDGKTLKKTEGFMAGDAFYRELRSLSDTL